MADSLTSHFTIDGSSIVSDSASLSPFIPNSGNIFPKFVDSLNETAWELWHFDAVSEKDRAAVVTSITRNGQDRKHGGFKVQVLAIWPDETTWHRDFYFPESDVTSLKGGDVVGVWKDVSNNSSITFQVSSTLSRAELTFHVVGVVEGRMTLTTQPGDTGLNTSPELGPSVKYVRPIGRASVVAEMSLYDSDSPMPRRFQLGLVDNIARGGMDRVWSLLAWPQIMTESYYLRAMAGPYDMEIMRIFSDIEKSPSKAYTVARLYKSSNLICAPQMVIHSWDEDTPEDSLILNKLYGNSNDVGRMGAFRDNCHGYSVEFIQRGDKGQRWQFHVIHDRILWNIPTSAPGPNATGNTGFVESVVGGVNLRREGVEREHETFEGVGTGGQCELS
ncbi:hypothetical protein HYFRA_00011527 [Hymenoscyphus fraxineus]|uniref:Uncharacterized protein n=1 Tax=Hymenoscyphus fraxineus TaxID=746836 RepID=A0A9N9PWV2_9HELO|nr:hypothetical protein HYFRA_00011527 [Hymenoscyphus fraxineus]